MNPFPALSITSSIYFFYSLTMHLRSVIWVIFLKKIQERTREIKIFKALEEYIPPDFKFEEPEHLVRVP